MVLSSVERDFIIQCIDLAFKRGDVRGDVGAVARTAAMATRIIQGLLEPGPPSVVNGAQREAAAVAQSE
jgi:hypothetical protein